MKVHKLFAANNIEIPFPQRDLNIKGVDNLLNRENKEERDEEPLDY